MKRFYDFSSIREAVVLLERVQANARLLALQNLCTNNDGIWTIPDDPKCYQPVLYEVALYDVPAVSDDPHQLPTNWLKAAKAILKAAPDTRVAA